MCSITFSPTARGYFLAMNRDEQRTRIAALPPQLHQVGGRHLLYPQEPGGGTWIGLRSDGVSLALLNWYSAPHQPENVTTSRGEIIPHLLRERESSELGTSLERLALDRYRPFRLIAVLQGDQWVEEWAWNGRKLEKIGWPRRLKHWFSSGFQEGEVQQVREHTAGLVRDDSRIGSLDWIRELHSSHRPGEGAFSICMHRVDARTVSYTEIAWEEDLGKMIYCPDSPCSGVPHSSHRLFRIAEA